MIRMLITYLKIFLDRYQPPDDVVNVSANFRDPWVASKAASLKEGTRILDAGAGECRYKHLFAHCDYKAQD